MSETIKSGLTPVAQKFILHWGEMGTRWGINRTVAQVHALLFLAPKPVPADEIATTLAVARSNVSTSLRELQGWGIVRVVHVLGDRRDHFESIKDVWEIFRIVSEERKRREIDPTLKAIGECVAELKANPQGDAYTRERLETMLEFLTVMTGLFEEILHMPTGALKGVVKLRGKVVTLLGQKKVANG
ncbi:MAG: MarR family transcriptional regulator [Candidatus Acidiferrum sp.]